jgi:hypothetical protein
MTTTLPTLHYLTSSTVFHISFQDRRMSPEATKFPLKRDFAPLNNLYPAKRGRSLSRRRRTNSPVFYIFKQSYTVTFKTAAFPPETTKFQLKRDFAPLNNLYPVKRGRSLSRRRRTNS